MISPYPQKNADSIQPKYSTLNNSEPDSKYPNYVSQATDTNKKISLSRNQAWPNQSQTVEAYTSTDNEQPGKKSAGDPHIPHYNNTYNNDLPKFGLGA